jgi:cytochrome c oxidase subunit IV
MIGLEIATLPRWVMLAVLLSAMIVKAALIAGNFMHLRFERAVLIWIVSGSLIATVLVMFVFLAVDALSILRLSN